MTESYPITGIIPPIDLDQTSRPSPQPLRQEVDVWYTNKNNVIQINLFFLALIKFQEMEVPDMLSYFRVAGVHARPNRSWDEEVEVPLSRSYCTHGRILFPTWHRPYAVLYEQRLYEIMIDEIKNFPMESQAFLRSEAAAWRLPYWDWATKRPSPTDPTLDYRVPSIVREKEVKVTFGHGPNEATTTEWRPNPMYEFRTPKPMGDYGVYGIKPLVDKDGNVIYPYDIAHATSRYPPKWDRTEASTEAWTNGVQNNDQVDEALQKHHWYKKDSRTIGEATARIFTISDYNDFASTKYDGHGPQGQYISSEYVHNNIHNWVGGPGGHMSEIPVAAFDPIFWMHHSNVDRIFAIWQTLHPEAWFEPKHGEDDNSTTPLTPFHTDKKRTLYTPDLARDWFKLHYSYPELQPWLKIYYTDGTFDRVKYLDDIKTQINKLYGSARETVLGFPGDGPAKVESIDYVINVIYERHALGGASYTIHFFLKDVENAKIGKDGKPVPVEIGSVYNFSSPNEECENCRRQEAAGERSRAQVPIPSALLTELVHPLPQPSLSAGDNRGVERYLTEHLGWNVTKGFGEEEPLESIPSLHIFVASGKAIHYKDSNKLSEYVDHKPLYGVTEGKLGGLERDYAF